MNQPVPLRPGPATPVSTAQRTAAAFAEIKALEDQHEALIAENEELRRSLDRCRNQVELLDKTLDREREIKEIYQRKLIRLAASMAGIGALTAEAVKIMEDAKEVEDARAAVAAQKEGT